MPPVVCLSEDTWGSCSKSVVNGGILRAIFISLNNLKDHSKLKSRKPQIFQYLKKMNGLFSNGRKELVI